MDEWKNKLVLIVLSLSVISPSGVRAWTGEIHGRVFCDVCGDSSIGPEDHPLEGKSSTGPNFEELLIGIFPQVDLWLQLVL